MEGKKMMEKPVARKEELVVQNVNDEILVYDLRTNKAYHLTETAAFVWGACDGKNTAEGIRQKLEERFKSKVNEEFVKFALEQLSENNLLKERLQSPLSISRREVLKRIGVASMIALPIVTSVIVPNTALAAVSCVGQTCAAVPPQCPDPCSCSGGICI